MTLGGSDDVGAQKTLLFGRDEELRTVVTALEGRGCVVAGPPGVGKSRLAADAAGGLGSERTVVRVVATAAAATIPFGAVSHLLPSGVTPAIAEFIGAFRDGALGPAPLLLVDDAHLLDDASAALLLALAASDVARLLLTIRSHESAPDAVVTLWKERQLDRVDLQPLSEREVTELVDALLGAPSHAVAYEWIYGLSGGNPLYVTELVADACRTGRLALRDDRWHLAEGEARFDRLGDLLAAHIGAVSAPARAALDLLAVGAPIRLAVFEELTTADALEELEQAGLAMVSKDNRGLMVEPAHPLYGEIVRAELPALAARRIRTELAGVLARLGADTPSERLSLARLLLESGRVDEPLFLDASAIAHRLGAPAFAADLAAALPPSLPAAMALASARLGAGRVDEVEAVLAPFEDEAATAPPDQGATYVETRVRCLLRSATGDPDLARRFVARLQSWHDDADWRALTAEMAVWLALHDRAFVEAGAIAEAALTDPHVGTERRIQLLLANALATGRRGRVDDYDALLSEVLHLEGEVEGRPLHAAMNLIRVEGGRMNAGRDLAGVRQRALRLLEDAPLRVDPFERVGVLYLLAHLEHVQGHHAAARALFERTLDLLAGSDAFNLTPITNTMLSITLSYLGEEAEARRALGRTEALIGERPSLGRTIALDVERARAMLELAAGRESAARELLLASAAAAGGDVLVATESLHVALLLGADPERCAAGLEALAIDAQDDVIHLWARHARAVADKDPKGQLAVAEAMAATGLDLDAAQAAALAASGFRREGLSRSANAASHLSAQCAARCPGVKMPALVGRVDAPDLTKREREVARLAAQGLPDLDIAASLHLSVRTVETYVLRVFRKLGVHSRGELAHALRPDQDAN